MKLGRWLLIGMVLLGVLGSLYYLGEDLTGNVVWEPVVAEGNCSNSYMLAFWEEIFKEPSTEVELLEVEGGYYGGCNRMAYKIVDTQIWIEMMGYEVPSYITYRNNEKLRYVNRSTGYGIYVNTTLNLTEVIGNPSTSDEFNDALNEVGEPFGDNNLTKWGVATNEEAKIEFDKIFRVSNDTFFGEDWGGGIFVRGFGESNYSNLKELEKTGFISSNETYIAFMWERSYFERTYPPVLIQNISNFTFVKNSGWHVAFNASDYFSEAEDYYISSLDPAPKYSINYTEVGGDILFGPIVNFTGTLRFFIEAGNDDGYASSNIFTVTIANETNGAPVFSGKIDDFVINMSTNLTFELDTFFADPEGTTLNYSVTGANKISVLFGGDRAYLWLKSNFTGPETLKIIASDGVHQTSSNSFKILLAVISEAPEEDPETEIDNSSLLVTPGNESGLNALNDSTDGESSKKIAIMMMVISGIVLVLLIIGAGVYFAFFHRSPIEAPIQTPAQAQADPVNEYLKKINSGASGTTG